MKRIVVSQRISFNSSRNESSDSLGHDLCSFLLKNQCIPFPIPNFPSHLMLDTEYSILSDWLLAIKPDGIVLSGGGDPSIRDQRYLLEMALLSYSKKNSIPLLGICRGMQFIAISCGASLKLVNGHVNTTHELVGRVNHIVNSYHDFAIDSCPGCFQILASSKDGIVEAIQHNKFPWQGWMWHPERPLARSVENDHLFKRLFY